MQREAQVRASDIPDPDPDRWHGIREVYPLTTDERASFVILSLYLVTFCIVAFVYWDSLVLQIAGITTATAGLILFVAAFFNTEAPERGHSIHPLRSYLRSFFWVLFCLVMLRFFGGLITNFTVEVIVLYVGLIVTLVIFRKAMIQVASAMLAMTFLFVTFHNLNDIFAGRIRLKDSVQQCGQALVQIGPIQDVANMLVAGSFITYLNRIDYRNEQIRTLAAKKVARTDDDGLRKTRLLLEYVSNEIHYVSDPADGVEYAGSPIATLIAGAGDCEDQALLLASLLESVGVNTYMAFTDEHVFVLVRFDRNYPDLEAEPFGQIDGKPCYALDPSGPCAVVGQCTARPDQVKRVFDVSRKSIAHFSPAL